MTPERHARMLEVLRNRQPGLGLVLENVIDPHNILAAMRSADAVGVGDLYIIHQRKAMHWDPKPRSSGTAHKWLRMHWFQSIPECMALVQQRYEHILATHLKHDSTDLYSLDLTQNVALVFGSERKGLSDEILPYTTGNFRIPMVGMVPNLNVSVACAITLYEAYRQRMAAGMYGSQQLPQPEMEQQLQMWMDRDMRRE